MQIKDLIKIITDNLDAARNNIKILDARLLNISADDQNKLIPLIRTSLKHVDITLKAISIRHEFYLEYMEYYLFNKQTLEASIFVCIHDIIETLIQFNLINKSSFCSMFTNEQSINKDEIVDKIFSKFIAALRIPYDQASALSKNIDFDYLDDLYELYYK